MKFNNIIDITKKQYHISGMGHNDPDGNVGCDNFMVSMTQTTALNTCLNKYKKNNLGHWQQRSQNNAIHDNPIDDQTHYINIATLINLIKENYPEYAPTDGLIYHNFGQSDNTIFNDKVCFFSP